MARIFITGSSAGLGLMAGQWLTEHGHQLVLHGRNQARADEGLASVPGAESAVTGGLSRIRDMKAVADQVNRLGRFGLWKHARASLACRFRTKPDRGSLAGGRHDEMPDFGTVQADKC